MKTFAKTLINSGIFQLKLPGLQENLIAWLDSQSVYGILCRELIVNAAI